jgi:hypothetical protein
MEATPSQISEMILSGTEQQIRIDSIDLISLQQQLKQPKIQSKKQGYLLGKLNEYVYSLLTTSYPKLLLVI